MAAVHKKSEAKKTENKTEEVKAEPVIVSDVVTETIEVIEEAPAAQPSSPQESIPDPLSDFKEKMVKEEFSASGSSPKKNYMWPILLIFVIAVAFLVGIFVYRQGLFKSEKIDVATPSSTPAPTPEPTIAPDLTKFEIEILNGSGVDGEASRQKLSLTAEGFTVSSVGNADNSDYTDTIIQSKEEVDAAFIDKLKTVLEVSFAAVKEEALSDDSSVPVIVILGTKK